MVLPTVQLRPPFTGACRLMYPAVANLRSKLGDAADNPAYIFTQPRGGYRMLKAEGREEP